MSIPLWINRRNDDDARILYSAPHCCCHFYPSRQMVGCFPYCARSCTQTLSSPVVVVMPCHVPVCPPQPGETVVVRSRSWFNDRPEHVPEGHVWLEGDNPSNSSDSRSYGPIPLAMVRGRVFFKVMVSGGAGKAVPCRMASLQ